MGFILATPTTPFRGIFTLSQNEIFIFYRKFAEMGINPVDGVAGRHQHQCKARGKRFDGRRSADYLLKTLPKPSPSKHGAFYRFRRSARLVCTKPASMDPLTCVLFCRPHQEAVLGWITTAGAGPRLEHLSFLTAQLVADQAS